MRLCDVDVYIAWRLEGPFRGVVTALKTVQRPRMVPDRLEVSVGVRRAS